MEKAQTLCTTRSLPASDKQMQDKSRIQHTNVLDSQPNDLLFLEKNKWIKDVFDTAIDSAAS